jgi:hypothetical protein
MPGVPAWLGHRAADFDGMGLADWVFPGFLFMVGMAIPFAIGNRILKGDNSTSLLKHILTRTVSLLIIGVLMANSRNVNGEFTGISKSLWSMIMYSGVFLIWYNYKQNDKNFYLINGLRLAGLVMIVPMVYIFRSGETDGFSFHSWGILGTIGWGYLVASLVYMGAHNNLMKTAIALLFFLIMNILSKLHLIDFLNPVKPVFGVIINGNAPFIVLSGMFITLILKKLSKDDSRKTVLIIASIGILSVLAGFIFRNWFKAYQMGALFKASRGKLPDCLPCTGYVLLHHLAIKLAIAFLQAFRFSPGCISRVYSLGPGDGRRSPCAA